jgi:hypothetical protein
MTTIFPHLRRIITAALERHMTERQQHDRHHNQPMPHANIGNRPPQLPQPVGVGAGYSRVDKICAPFPCTICGHTVTEPHDVEQMTGRCLPCQREETPT